MKVIRLLKDSLSFLLPYAVKGYLLLLIGGYCLIYFLIKRIIKLGQGQGSSARD